LRRFEPKRAARDEMIERLERIVLHKFRECSANR
jgi:hypothetical protein